MLSARSRIDRLRGAVVALALGALAAAACTRSAPARGQAAATVFPLYDLARRVAGDRLEVRLILAPGLDPHDYEPRPKDVVGLEDAGLIFAVGLGLDPWAQSLARSAGAGEARVFELGPLMDPILAPPGMIRPEPLIDPHFWTDPVRAQRAVDVIVEALSGLDPPGAPFYRERGEHAAPLDPGAARGRGPPVADVGPAPHRHVPRVAVLLRRALRAAGGRRRPARAGQRAVGPAPRGAARGAAGRRAGGSLQRAPARVAARDARSRARRGSCCTRSTRSAAGRAPRATSR